MKPLIQVFSSGGGTQSCAIAALIVQGRLPKPEFAVIVDTEREHPAVWMYHDAHIVPALDSVGVEIFRIPKSSFATVDLWSGINKDTVTLPAFTSIGDDVGKLPAYCSNEWKLRVMQRYLKLTHGVEVNNTRRWIGFSLDEASRASRMMGGRDYKEGRIFFPLINGVAMRRNDAIKLASTFFGETPPRSACWMCPNHSDSEWRELKEKWPVEFAAAVELETHLRRSDDDLWFHRSCVPLGEVDFSEPEDLFSRACDSGACFI